MAEQNKKETTKKSESILARWGIVFILLLQLGLYLPRINDYFYDGRFHVNWGPPFWLNKAEKMHQVNFFKAYLCPVAGVKETPSGLVSDGCYSSHPQFIAIPLYIWTGLFGFGEWVVRSLTMIFTLATGVLLWLALRQRHTAQQSFLATLFWSVMPLMVTYGSKLDQEPFVMFFLALAFWAHERFYTEHKNAIWFWGLATLGMIWSDWSGFIFAGLFGLVLLAVQFKHKPTRALLASSVVGGALGTGIVVAQTWLERSGEGVGGITAGFTHLYKYRADTAMPGFWSYWFDRQRGFFWDDFSNVFGFLGLGYLLARFIGLTKRWRQSLQTGAQLLHLMFLVVLGTFIYAVTVSQASSIHIYYQYYYAAPVAYGLMLLVEYLQRAARSAGTSLPVGGGLTLLIFGVSLYWGISFAHTDVAMKWGGKEEIELIKKIKNIPKDKTLSMVAPKDFSAWIDNPNIEYYAGRQIFVAESVAEGLKDNYILVGNNDITKQIAELEKIAGAGNSFVTKDCSPLLCLLERVENKK